MTTKQDIGKPRILILGCGGTIASVPNEKGILVPAQTVQDIVDLVPSIVENADVTLLQLENLDSSELTPNHWTKFATAIATAISSGNYKGIILTHGTDTMAYSATAISIIFGTRLPIPVIFTGSQLGLVAFGTDARFNLENSFKVMIRAIEDRVAEVMIVFSDVVLRACRAVKVSDSSFRAFDSPAYLPLAMIRSSGIRFSREVHRARSNVVFRIEDLHLRFVRGVVVFDLVPGMEPGVIFDTLRSGKCNGLILRSLGVGNVPSLDEYSLIPCIEESVRLGIPVVITTKFVGGTTHARTYGPGAAAIDAGAIESGDLTDVAVQVKLMWLMNQGVRGYAEIQRALLTPVAGEVTKRRR